MAASYLNLLLLGITVVQAQGLVTTPDWPLIPTFPTIGQIQLTLPEGESGIEYEIVQLRDSIGDEEVWGNYGSDASRKQRFTVIPGQHYTLALRARSATDADAISEFGPLLTFSARERPKRILPKGTVIRFPSPSPGQIGWTVSSDIDGQLADLSATATEFSSWPRNISIGVHRITVLELTADFHYRVDNVIMIVVEDGSIPPKPRPISPVPTPALPTRLRNDRSIVVPTLIPGKGEWRIRVDLSREVARLSARDSYHILNKDSLSLGLHLITVESVRGGVMYHFLVNRPLIDPDWPVPPTFEGPQVLLTLPTATQGVRHEVTRIYANGTRQQWGSFSSDESRQQRFTVVPGRSYSVGLRAINTVTRQISGFGQLATFSAPPLRVGRLASGGLIEFPSALPGQQNWVVRSDRDDVLGNLSAKQQSYVVDKSQLSPGQQVITVETGDGDVIIRLSALIEAMSGEYVGGPIRALWDVNAARSGIDVQLSATVGDNMWIGFGVSRNQLMRDTDVITAYFDTAGRAVVDDRYAVGRVRPAIDPSSQVTNVSGSKLNGMASFNFTLPCTNSDRRDIPVQGRRYLQLAYGPVLPEVDIGYHGPTARFISSLNAITC